jgi:hypothetical protein
VQGRALRAGSAFVDVMLQIERAGAAGHRAGLALT